MRPSRATNEQEIKPHKVRYYLERRDPEFKQKMAEVLCVYREVRLIKETAAPIACSPSIKNPLGIGHVGHLLAVLDERHPPLAALPLHHGLEHLAQP